MNRAAPSNVIRSVMAPESIAPVVAREYEFAEDLECVLHAVNLNEHYFVRAGGVKYIFRLYSNCGFCASSESEYRFELEWLDFLRQRGAPVAYPLPRKNGDLLGRMKTPEGPRHFALFSFAEGEQVYPPTPAQSERLGAEVAGIHLASNDFRTTRPRIDYDLEVLVDDPVRRIRRFLGTSRPEDQEFLVELAARLKEEVANLPRSGDCYGVIGGGFVGTNQHFTEDGEVTFFEFDFCGRGWRVFDVAQFCWHGRLYHAPPEIRDAFVAGYQSRRALHADELAAISAFVKIKHIFTMGYHTTYADWMGDASFDDYYWDKHFEPLRDW